MSSKIRIATKILKDLFSLYSIPFSIRESGPLGNLELTVKVDSSKFHMLGPNYDSNYYKFFEVLNGTYSVGQYSTTVNLGMLSAGEYIAILRKDDELYSERTSVVK